jgi:hypothetical protein
MNSFDHIIEHTGEVHHFNKKFKISHDEFELFLKEYTFEKLRGFSMAEYFMSKYSIEDFILRLYAQIENDMSTKDMLLTHYVKK